MEEDKGNGVLVEDASKSQQEGQEVSQGPEPLFNPPDPEEVLEAEDLVPRPQPGEPPGEVEVPQLVVNELSSCTSQTPRGDSLMQEVYQAGLEQEEIDRAVQERERRACSWPPMILTSTFILRDDMVDTKWDDICHFIWLTPLRYKLEMPLNFIREGLHQSVGGVVSPSKLYKESEEEWEEKHNENMMLLTTAHTRPIIDGCAVTVT
jgi:hypothetical protein